MMIMTKCQNICVCILLMKTAAVVAELKHGGNQKVKSSDDFSGLPTRHEATSNLNVSEQASKSVRGTEDQSLQLMNDEGVSDYTKRRQEIVQNAKNTLGRVPGFQIFMESVGLRLFEQFGLALKYASEDILSKLGFLNRLNQKDGVNYKTFESMFEHEFSTGDVHDGKKDSGVRSNRIIHRGLELFYRILKELNCTGDNCGNSMSSRVRHHYDMILSHYHSYFVRGAAHFALMAFPSRESMLSTLGLPTDSHGVQQVSELATAVGKVYHKIEALYNHYPKIND